MCCVLPEAYSFSSSSEKTGASNYYLFITFSSTISKAQLSKQILDSVWQNHPLILNCPTLTSKHCLLFVDSVKEAYSILVMETGLSGVRFSL